MTSRTLDESRDSRISKVWCNVSSQPAVFLNRYTHSLMTLTKLMDSSPTPIVAWNEAEKISPSARQVIQTAPEEPDIPTPPPDALQSRSNTSTPAEQIVNERVTEGENERGSEDEIWKKIWEQTRKKMREKRRRGMKPIIAMRQVTYARCHRWKK